MSDAAKLANLRTNSPLLRRPQSLREVESLARIHTRDAINVLAEIAQDPAAPAAARVSAATSLLDRGWGKAQQIIRVEAPLTQAEESDLERLIRERLEGIMSGEIYVEDEFRDDTDRQDTAA